jgi:hypothetical protein
MLDAGMLKVRVENAFDLDRASDLRNSLARVRSMARGRSRGS